ncbi:phosphoadenosine phosphosulfate reductase domain-containing protein [Asanoa siamensis]|uniref:Phosphoadenosine phosphosulphate reductase domain-containing protein n=1 Tax=Asanoa siamensis TaxID=926357 RepID=A0ABQ4D3L5_9ACTN|nr:phosphoadenosine phosphosulfate reductase family protein [Asanoa siamensis]GIF78111.1 hypothetical protein Asi02nite_76290 [Asanoa siamensis]
MPTTNRAGKPAAKPQPLADFVFPFGPGGNPAEVDLWLLNSSGGKDSQEMIRAAADRLREAGLLDRLITERRIWVQHNGLGDDPHDGVEWAGTCELAAEQAARYGLPFIVTHRDGPDLIDDIAARRRIDGSPRGFPRLQFRFCTREHKTAPSERFIRAQGAQLGVTGRPMVVVQTFGFRAAESPRRASRPVWSFNPRASTLHTRKVYDWLPIHELSTDQVWAGIRAAGVPYHPAYKNLGMSRLSCRMCVLAGERDLLISARANPGTAQRILAVEQATAMPFQDNRTMAQIIAKAGPASPFRVTWVPCPTCGVRVLIQDSDPDRHCPAHAATGPWDQHHRDRLSGCIAQATLFDLETA